jgi:hypothetical protein
MVEINSSHHVKFPYCAGCAAKIKEQMDSYPPFEKKKGTK